MNLSDIPKQKWVIVDFPWHPGTGDTYCIDYSCSSSWLPPQSLELPDRFYYPSNHGPDVVVHCGHNRGDYCCHWIFGK